MAISETNQAFLKFKLRADKLTADEIVATFVDAEPLVTLLQRTDHQIIYGRRGTGKTHLMSYVATQRQEDGHASLYIDLRQMGSDVSLYNEQGISVAERATRLLCDLMNEIHNQAIHFAVDFLKSEYLGQMTIAVDSLANAAATVKVVGEYEHIDNNTNKSYAEWSGSAQAQVGKVKFGASGTRSLEVADDAITREKGARVNRVMIGKAADAMRDVVIASRSEVFWVFIDEWSAIPSEVQPYLADLVRRVFFPIKSLSVKIAAIEQRSTFKKTLPGPGDYIGIEVGADATADVNLDEFMVYDANKERSRDFFAHLIMRHYKAVSGAMIDNSTTDFTGRAFTQINVFDEFVRASEGVPRDALNILSLAAQRAMSEKISMIHVREAARDWYQRDKERAATVNDKAKQVLHWIIDEVIGEKRSRAFLLRNSVSHPLIDELFDGRVIHVLKRNVSAKDEPGIRYDVYKLDYGCYVDLMTTNRAVKGLFELDNGDFIDVPPDDYRSIRRAVLDLDKFEHQSTAGSGSPVSSRNFAG